MDRGTWRATVHGVTKEPGTTYQINKSKKYFLMLDIYGEGRNKKGGGVVVKDTSSRENC